METEDLKVCVKSKSGLQLFYFHNRETGTVGIRKILISILFEYFPGPCFNLFIDSKDLYLIALLYYAPKVIAALEPNLLFSLV